jgi:hypothetical protein
VKLNAIDILIYPVAFSKIIVDDLSYTVELGYNDHGYNEFTAITNQIFRNFTDVTMSRL